MTVTVKAATARTCPLCAARYGAVVDIGCRMCGGIGTVVVTAAEADLPATCHAVSLFALRPDRPAVTAGTAAEYDLAVAVDRRSLVAAGLVSGPTDASTILDLPADQVAARRRNLACAAADRVGHLGEALATVTALSVGHPSAGGPADTPDDDHDATIIALRPDRPAEHRPPG